jgi:hypothetical protein
VARTRPQEEQRAEVGGHQDGEDQLAHRRAIGVEEAAAEQERAAEHHQCDRGHLPHDDPRLRAFGVDLAQRPQPFLDRLRQGGKRRLRARPAAVGRERQRREDGVGVGAVEFVRHGRQRLRQRPAVVEAGDRQVQRRGQHPGCLPDGHPQRVADRPPGRQDRRQRPHPAIQRLQQFEFAVVGPPKQVRHDDAQRRQCHREQRPATEPGRDDSRQQPRRQQHEPTRGDHPAGADEPPAGAACRRRGPPADHDGDHAAGHQDAAGGGEKGVHGRPHASVNGASSSRKSGSGVNWAPCRSVAAR